jgi:hypothetical protein
VWAYAASTVFDFSAELGRSHPRSITPSSDMGSIECVCLKFAVPLAFVISDVEKAVKTPARKKLGFKMVPPIGTVSTLYQPLCSFRIALRRSSLLSLSSLYLLNINNQKVIMISYLGLPCA